MGEVRRVLLAVSMFAGTIIGAGVFSLPYILSKTGMLLGGALLLLFSAFYAVIYRRYADVYHQFHGEEQNHRFVYLSERLLSPAAAGTAAFVVIAELFFTLAAYIILSASFAGLLGVPQHIAWFVFWAIGSTLLFARARMLGIFEFLGTLGIIAIGVLFVVLRGTASLPLFPANTPTLPEVLSFFGVLVFMLSGRPAVPEAYKFFSGKRMPWNVLVLGVAVPLVFYVFFGVGVLHLTAYPATDTVSGLVALPPLVTCLIGILGLLTLLTSYLTIGDNAKDILEDDVFHEKTHAVTLTLFLPLLLVMFGLREFITVIGVAGGIFLALEAIFINRMWERTFRASPLAPMSVAIYLVFGAALAAEAALLVGLL